MNEASDWLRSAAALYLAMFVVATGYSFIGWLLWEYIVFPFFQ